MIELKSRLLNSTFILFVIITIFMFYIFYKAEFEFVGIVSITVFEFILMYLLLTPSMHTFKLCNDSFIINNLLNPLKEIELKTDSIEVIERKSISFRGNCIVVKIKSGKKYIFGTEGVRKNEIDEFLRLIKEKL